VWLESSLCATHFECLDMRLHATLKHERRVAVAIAGWMQLLLDLNQAALNTLSTDFVQAAVRSAMLQNGFPYVLWGIDRYCYHLYCFYVMALNQFALTNRLMQSRHSCNMVFGIFI